MENNINTKEEKNRILEIKKEMIEFSDLLGSKLSPKEIEECQSKEDLAKLLDSHCDHIEGMANDTISGVDKFRERLGLTGF